MPNKLKHFEKKAISVLAKNGDKVRSVSTSGNLIWIDARDPDLYWAARALDALVKLGTPEGYICIYFPNIVQHIQDAWEEENLPAFKFGGLS